ncbi:hypothetical protein [Cereibacter azotoformans]|uniref:Uncharacterized protein n=1 Tax=Cereibacter azotoformans TaxID=43057 RepID=A0A2T5JSJ1_9RHOB|nr:hypothetical protein [Cereibacter azotoformans]MBO4168914.1 hypothetical protein [Cereibacter azotoformans]PTR11189.1 hypothetical protein C8J28_12850 [Cereibacter azotoformans]
MPVLIYMSWAAYTLGAALLLVSLVLETYVFLPAAVAAGVCGVAFAVGAKIVDLLTEIRDRLPAPQPAQVAELPEQSPQPVRSLSELSADLERKRVRG